jgi:hypothetical protein
MLQRDLKKDDVLQLAYSILSKLSPTNTRDSELVEDSLQLYRQGLVYNVAVDKGRIVGVVEDEERIYLPILHLDHPDQNGCDCYEAPPCHHQVALLFYAAASHSLVGEIMRKFKQSALLAIPNVMTGRQLLEQMTIVESADYEETIRLFEQKYENYLENQRNSLYQDVYFIYPLYERYYQMLLNSQPKQEKEKLHYQLLAAIFTMKKMALQMDIQSSHYRTNNQPREIIMLENQIDAFTRQLRNITGGSLNENYIRVLKEQLHELLFKPAHCLVARYNVFRDVYKELLQYSPTSIKESMKELQNMKSSMTVELALAHLSFILQDDEKTIAILSKVEDSIHFLMYWIESLRTDSEEKRTFPYLTFFYEKLRVFLRSSEDEYIKRMYAKQFLSRYEYFSFKQNEIAGLEVVYQSLLPYSEHEYGDYLMHHGEYKRWVELQMVLYGKNPDQIDTSDLQEVYREQPHILLPIYHLLVIYHIELRSRDHYKIAVRHLKKLRASYRKLKRLEDWERYITYITSTYNRLRALQEEIMKGKLVNEPTNKS